MKTQLQTSTVSAAVSDNVAELVSLGEEYRDWYDNLPPGLQDHRSDIDEAASTFENITEPTDCPVVIAELPVEYAVPTKTWLSRSDRGSQAIYVLNVVVEVINAWLEENEKHAAQDEVEYYRDEIQSAIDEAEGAEYPGMYA